MKRTLTLMAAGLLAACAGGGGGGTEAAESEITASGIRQDIAVLAADSLEGRGTGTQGEAKAAAFIAARYEEAGLGPVNGSYFQDVRMVGMKKRVDASSLTLHWTTPTGAAAAIELDEGVQATFWSTTQEEIVDIEDAPLLFAGYGVEAPEYGWDDFGDADVEGKVLLFLNDDPPVTEDGEDLFGGEARTYYGRWTYKFEQAMARGAAGALMIHTTQSASYPFSVVQNSGSGERWAVDIPGTGYQVPMVAWIDEETSEFIANQMSHEVGRPLTLDELFEMGRQRDFTPVETGFTVSAHIETDIRTNTTSNVIGMLEGTDLSDGVIVFSAHYDHLGTNEAAEGDDKIFNGAWDNAAGTAGIIALAEAFAAGPRPRRSILFLAAAAEEAGSLGSLWFVANPPFERHRLVGNFNVDMPQIFGLTYDMAAIGVETNSLGDALREVAAEVLVDGERPLTVTGDPNPAAGSFYRSDQVNFAKAGIPALFVNPGVDYVSPPAEDPREYRNAHYHQASDELNDVWNLAGMERDLRVVYRAALRVANADDMPRWAPGNEFEEEWKALHGR